MRIPIFCSLVPTDLILSLGHEVHFVEPQELAAASTQEYHCAFHENLCSYGKTLYDYLIGAARSSDFGAIIVPTSCDALKKLFNSLCITCDNTKIYCLNVPQNKGAMAEDFLAAQFEGLINKLGKADAGDSRSSLLAPRSPLAACGGNMTSIGILGSNVQLKALDSCLKKFGFRAVYLNHCLAKAYPDHELLTIAKTGDMKKYAGAFLGKNSCPRTNDDSYKAAIKKRVHDENISAIIVNTIKFCDFHSFDYRYFKDALGIPALLIEHELTANYEGQIMTRIEAFFEGIRNKRIALKRADSHRHGKYFVGLDSGSHATKLVCVDSDERVVFKDIVNTGTSVKNSVEILLKNLETKAGIKSGHIANVVGTGYGRNNIEGTDKVVTEISCHAKGAHHILEKAATIIDIGGQDSKVIKIDAAGNVVQFAMNDKCAAGTGRFLEVMANKLEMSLSEFAMLAYNSEKHVPISSMCSVFAESEVISLIASGATKEEIAGGVHKSIADRTVSLVKRINGTAPFYMAGGVAKNLGLVAKLEESLGEKITVIKEPQFSGALGAALFALMRD